MIDRILLALAWLPIMAVFLFLIWAIISAIYHEMRNGFTGFLLGVFALWVVWGIFYLGGAI